MLAPEARLYRVPAGARKSLIVVNSRLPADLLSRRPGARRDYSFGNLTEAGIKAAKDSPRRLDAAKKLLADMGGEMKQFYMVMGEFDFVLRGSGRRRHGPLRLAAWGPRLRAHEDAEGFPGDRLPRNCPLAKLSLVGS
jgi:hypothetical protein